VVKATSAAAFLTWMFATTTAADGLYNHSDSIMCPLRAFMMDGELTVKVPVGTVAHEGSGSEVDQFEIEGVEVDQEIFVLDVPVDHTLTVAGQNRLHHLAEKVASHRLLQHALLRDEIKQIFARFGSLHDNYKGVVALKAVQDLDHSGATVDFSEQADFQWNWSSINLEINFDNFTFRQSSTSRNHCTPALKKEELPIIH
jgi:hypothetical protein